MRAVLATGAKKTTVFSSRVGALGYVSRYSTSVAEYDTVVVGGGPGGYVAAIKAAQLGQKTACIESRSTLGGTCLNVGCIPSKALLHNSELFHQSKTDFASRGIEVSGVKLNLGKMMEDKDKKVGALTKGIEFLFKKNKVEWIKGKGSFAGTHDIAVALNKGGEQVVRGKHIVVATGSVATEFPGFEVDEKQIVTSTGALSLQQVPKKLLVIGGGVIGLELGSVWSRLGSEVTVVEYLPAIGAGMDAGVAKQFQRILAKQGIKFRLGTKVTGSTKTKSGVVVTVEPAKGGPAEQLAADVVLLSVGRRPYTDGLALERAGLQAGPRGILAADASLQTAVPHIHVIGDVTSGPMLAHKAEEEGIAVAERIARGHGHVNYAAIPAVVYTHPEVAWVGATEQQASEQTAGGADAVVVAQFPFAANSRAKAIGDTEGFVKVVTEKSTDRVLGVHIIGPNAGEMIAEAVLAIEYGASSEDIARTCHAHPTLSEALKEACLACCAAPIHA